MRSNLVKIVEKNSGDVLFSYSPEELDLAYQKAEELEDLGLDIQLLIPSTAETLLNSLGAQPKDIDRLKKEIDQEISSHEQSDSCTYCSKSL